MIMVSLWLAAAFWIDGGATDELIALAAIPVAYLVGVLLLGSTSSSNIR